MNTLIFSCFELYTFFWRLRNSWPLQKSGFIAERINFTAYQTDPRETFSDDPLFLFFGKSGGWKITRYC